MGKGVDRISKKPVREFCEDDVARRVLGRAPRGRGFLTSPVLGFELQTKISADTIGTGIFKTPLVFKPSSPGLLSRLGEGLRNLFLDTFYNNPFSPGYFAVAGFADLADEGNTGFARDVIERLNLNNTIIEQNFLGKKINTLFEEHSNFHPYLKNVFVAVLGEFIKVSLPDNYIAVDLQRFRAKVHHWCETTVEFFEMVKGVITELPEQESAVIAFVNSLKPEAFFSKSRLTTARWASQRRDTSTLSFRAFVGFYEKYMADILDESGRLLIDALGPDLNGHPPIIDDGSDKLASLYPGSSKRVLERIRRQSKNDPGLISALIAMKTSPPPGFSPPTTLWEAVQYLGRQGLPILRKDEFGVRHHHGDLLRRMKMMGIMLLGRAEGQYLYAWVGNESIGRKGSYYYIPQSEAIKYFKIFHPGAELPILLTIPPVQYELFLRTSTCLCLQGIVEYIQEVVGVFGSKEVYDYVLLASTSRSVQVSIPSAGLTLKDLYERLLKYKENNSEPRQSLQLADLVDEKRAKAKVAEQARVRAEVDYVKLLKRIPAAQYLDTDTMEGMIKKAGGTLSPDPQNKALRESTILKKLGAVRQGQENAAVNLEKYLDRLGVRGAELAPLREALLRVFK